MVTVEKYKKGDAIFKEGSYGQIVFIILKGKVEISKISDGKKVVIETLGPRDLFGEMSFVDSEPRSATATALEDAEIGLLDKMTLDVEFNKLTEEIREIMKTLVERLRKTTRRTTALSIELHNLRKERSK
jgi:CRP-like cAMP-binding protein